jgi:hypothetical protein
VSLTGIAVTAAEAVWNANQVHAAGEVPGSPVTPYLALSVTAPGDTNYRAGGRGGSQSAWTVVQAVGKTANEVDFAVTKADAAFLGKRLTVTGKKATPARRDAPSTIIRDPDAGGLLTCTLVYRFTLNPA